MAERRETAVGQRNLRRRRVLQACCGLALCAPAVSRGDETDDAVAPPQADDALVFAYGDRAGRSSRRPTSFSAPSSCSPTQCI